MDGEEGDSAQAGFANSEMLAIWGEGELPGNVSYQCSSGWAQLSVGVYAKGEDAVFLAVKVSKGYEEQPAVGRQGDVGGVEVALSLFERRSSWNRIYVLKIR